MRLNVLLALAPLAFTQVIYEEPKLRPKFQHFIRSSLAVEQNYATYALPSFIDNAKLLEEKKAAQKGSGPFMFGKAFTVQLNEKDGVWQELPGKAKLWRLAIHSRNAVSLNLIFDEFQLPPEGELYVSAFSTKKESEPQTLGPFTYLNNKLHRQFSTMPVAGNTILLEYYAPEAATKPFVNISHVVHGYRYTKFTRDQSKSSGSCNINVACLNGRQWRKQVRSTVMMLSQSGQGFCSGALLNNVRKDGRQLFLTAYHCTDSDNSRDMVMFNYQASACDGSSSPNPRQTAQGLKLLSKWFLPDFALFEVEDFIPREYNAYLAGWSADASVPALPVVIHHPSADIKKISFTDTNSSEACWGGRCSRLGFDHWKVNRYSRGTTEPGSSGSPLFDNFTKRVVGQLHGGSASCTEKDGYDVYGKLVFSFDQSTNPEMRMKEFLDPDNTGVRALDGIGLNAARRGETVDTEDEDGVQV